MHQQTACGTQRKVANVLVLHGFADENDDLLKETAHLRRGWMAAGASKDAQLRSLLPLARLRDTAVARWMAREAWCCRTPADLSRFILGAPCDKAPGSCEISLMGEETRNSSAAVPVWPLFREGPDCWTRALQVCASYTTARGVTEAKVYGASNFVAKNIANLIYDTDAVFPPEARLMPCADRSTAMPQVGPGPRRGICWLTGGAIKAGDKNGASAFLSQICGHLGDLVVHLHTAPGRTLWRGEWSPTQVQLHTCAAHRWATRLRLKVGPSWHGCRVRKPWAVARPARRLRAKRTPAEAGLVPA